MTNFNTNGNTPARTGNGRGINTLTLIDCRLAGPVNYHPRHRKPGATKDTQAQANGTVYQNIRDKKVTIPITAWGKMADVLARGGATGKQLHLVCSVHSYRGRVWVPVADGQAPQCVMLADNQPLLIEKIGFTVESLSFGIDSAKTVQEELQSGFRPAGWNDPATPGYQEWRNRCQANNSIQFDPNTHAQWFGYARVKPVNGQIVVAQPGGQGYQGQGQGQGYQTPANTQQGNAQQYQQANTQQYQQNSTAVQNGFQGAGNAQTSGNAQTGGNPQYVNGQYVGQQMQNQQNQGHAPQTAQQGNHPVM